MNALNQRGTIPATSDHDLPSTDNILASPEKPDELNSQDELAWVLTRILTLPIRSGTVGENYLPQDLKQQADVAIDRWRRQRTNGLKLVGART